MSEAMHKLTLEVLKAKHNLCKMSNSEIHAVYRKIYSDLLSVDDEYVKSHHGQHYLA